MENLKKNPDIYTIHVLNTFISLLRPFKYHIDMKLKVKNATINTIVKFNLNKVYRCRVYDSKQKRLFSSKFFKKILKLFDDRINNKTKKKLVIFSGFDRNIADILSNIFDLDYLKNIVMDAVHNKDSYSLLIPPLASNFIIELLREKNTKNYFIRILYNGKEIKGKFCSKVDFNERLGALDYKDFHDMIESKIDNNYHKLICSNLKLN